MKYFFLALFLMSCTTSKKNNDWVDGCVFGSTVTLEYMANMQIPQELHKSIGVQCKSFYGYQYGQ